MIDTPKGDPLMVFVTAEALSGDVLDPIRSLDEMLSAFEAVRPWVETAAKEMRDRGAISPVLIRDIPMVI